MFRSSLVVSSLVILAACTQAPASVSLRGQEDFSCQSGISPSGDACGRRASVASASPVYNAPVQQAAAVSSISVADLEPSAGGSAPVQQAESKPVFAVHMNPWTKKTRESNVAESTPPASQSSPFIWPVASREILASFGTKAANKSNDGISIAAQEGEPVWAAADGEVVYADSSIKGYGNMILVKHNNGKTTTYAHLARVGVEKYDRVKQGDIIGYVGSTGSVKAPQLYFSMRDGSKAVDPQHYTNRKVAGL